MKFCSSFKVLSLPDCIQTPLIEKYELQGQFKSKVRNALETALGSTFLHFDEILWRKCEVGHYTGNQLLCGLVALSRDRELIPAGSGVVMTVDGKLHLSMYFCLGEGVIFRSPSPEDEEKNKYFNKIFDENCVEIFQDNLYHQHYYTEDKLRDIRAAVPEMLPTFLNQQISETRLEYRHAFTGLFQELIIFEMCGNKLHEFIALHLQLVFGWQSTTAFRIN